MQSLSKKGVDPGFSVVVGMVLGLVLIAFVVSLVVISQTGFLNVDTASQIGCWMTNTVSCKGGILTEIGSLCFYEVMEEPGDMERFATSLRNTWWMYKENNCDFGNLGDEVYPSYSFTPDEDIALSDFFVYISSHNNGKETDIAHSDYARFEENTEGPTLCFDKESFASQYLEEAETYYIMYYDDQVPHEDGDILLISGKPEFNAGYWQAKWYSYLPKFWLLSTGAVVKDIIFDPKEGACIAYAESPTV